MKIFIKKCSIFLSIVVFLYSSSIIFVYFIGAKYTTSPFSFLYHYQLGKLRTVKNVNTVFIGDSSLGNCINTNHFDSLLINCKSVNLALTGYYGYAGSYNMLKKAIKQYPTLKNVVIMQTLGLQTREISYRGYAYTATSAEDFYELSFWYMFNSLIEYANIRDAFFTISRNIANKNIINSSLIKDDYIKQGNKRNFSDYKGYFNPLKIQSNKNYFLKKISEICKDNDLNLIYIHGPILNKIANNSLEYINATNTIISNSDVFLIEQIITVENEELGDESDHINPNAKNKYSKIVEEILRPYLKFQ